MSNRDESELTETKRMVLKEIDSAMAEINNYLTFYKEMVNEQTNDDALLSRVHYFNENCSDSICKVMTTLGDKLRVMDGWPEDVPYSQFMQELKNKNA